MKIIIPVLGVFGKSGGWRVLSKLADHWMEFGEEVEFLVFENTDTPYYPTKSKIRYYDSSGNIKDYSNTRIKKPFLAYLRLQSALTKALDKLEADVVLANHSLSAYPVKKSRIKAKKYYYVQAYEPDFYYKNNLKDFIFRWISKKSYHLGLRIIVNAPMYLDYKEIKTDMFVFPGLDLQNFKPLEKKIREKKIVIGTIGRSEEYKGTKYILEGFQKVWDKLEEKVELRIAFGERELEIQDGVKIVNPHGDIKLAEYYRSLDMYICAGTIQHNAVHYPVIEAMACKIPVITTGYLPSSEENSWQVPVRNPDAIATRIFELINEETSSKTERAYKDIVIFDWQKIAQKMLQYFKS
nr:glycosyltransferase family 4 protein [uncultured Chryseobacterium sp.]